MGALQSFEETYSGSADNVCKSINSINILPEYEPTGVGDGLGIISL